MVPSRSTAALRSSCSIVGPTVRNDRWSEAIAVGNLALVEKVKSELGFRAVHREVEQKEGMCVLREPTEAYAGKLTFENDALTPENTVAWERTIESAEI